LYILIFMFLDSKREDKRFWTECLYLLGLFYEHEDGGIMFFRIVSKLLLGYRASHPRTQNSSYTNQPIQTTIFVFLIIMTK
jgi:hypothetical protein